MCIRDRYRPVETPALLDTEAEDIKFQKEIIKAGFEILAKKQLSELCNCLLYTSRCV